MIFKDKSVTPTEIAERWGNKTALKAEEEIDRIEKEILANDQAIDAGELEFDNWERKQEELRTQILPLREIIRKETARYRPLKEEIIERERRSL